MHLQWSETFSLRRVPHNPNEYETMVSVGIPRGRTVPLRAFCGSMDTTNSFEDRFHCLCQFLTITLYSGLHWVPIIHCFILLASFGDVSDRLINQSIFPGISTGVENVSFNGILLMASAFHLSHPFLYRRVYSYTYNVSAHFWIRLEANGGIAFVSSNCPVVIEKRKIRQIK